MSKSDKEHYQKLQAKAIQELKYYKEEFSKVNTRLDELEQQPAIKEYIQVKYEWQKHSDWVNAAQGRLGLWTFVISQLKDEE